MNPDPGASASGPMQVDALQPGELFDRRYRIVKKLGEGGMGEVYAAKHEHIEKRVAIKLLRPEIVTNKEAVARFAQEARSASGIGHKNIIGIDDFGFLPDGRIYLSMEYLDGQPLNDMIKTPGGLPHDRLLNILIQTGHGLSAAHARGIVHRDMKPENIFVTVGPNGEDVPKLLDFGIAKVAGNDGQNNLTRTGTIFGTPFYMAPEQALGQQIDGRVDIYAMGVIIYEVFAGSLPFRGESFMGILTQHITTEPEPIAQRAAAAHRPLPPGIAEITARAMAKDPNARFQTMDELVQALVGVYRHVAGAGMSQYMEAHQPPRSAMMPTQMSGGMPPTGGMAPHPGMQTPGPMGPMGQPMGGYPMGGQPMGSPMTPGPMVVSSTSSGFGASDGSMMMPAKKSKAGLIFAIIALLAVIGGGIAVFVISQNKSGESAETTDDPEDPAIGSGSADGSGTGAAIGSGTGAEAGSGSGTAGAGSGTADGSGSAVGSGSGSQVAATTIDAGTAAVAVDAQPVATATPDAAPAKVEPITVLVDASASGATIWENGKKIGKVPEMIKVVPGEQRTLVLKAKNHKDETVVVDGERNEVVVKLTRTGGGGGGNGNGSGSSTGSGSGSSGGKRELTPAEKQALFCKKNPDDMKCQLED